MDRSGFDFICQDVVARSQRREPDRQPTFTQTPQFLLHRPGATVFGIGPGSRHDHRNGPVGEVSPYPSSCAQQFRFNGVSVIGSAGARDSFLNVRVLRNFVVQFQPRHNRFVRIEECELRADLLTPCSRVTTPLPVPVVGGLIAAAQTAWVNENQERFWVMLFHWQSDSCNGSLAGCPVCRESLVTGCDRGWLRWRPVIPKIIQTDALLVSRWKEWLVNTRVDSSFPAQFHPFAQRQGVPSANRFASPTVRLSPKVEIGVFNPPLVPVS